MCIRDRSNDHFDYHIYFDGEKGQEQIMIPPMLIQPYVENAIKHGLLPKKEKGELLVQFKLETDGLYCTIKDDGVGMDLAKKEQPSLKSYPSLGSKLVSERVELLNEMGYNIDVKSTSAINEGTEVLIKIIDKF